MDSLHMLLIQEREMAEKVLIENTANRPYYDEQADKDSKYQYYQSVSFIEEHLFEQLHLLSTNTHTITLDYTPHWYLYPWVDLQENGKLKSLYSGKGMDPLKTIEHDIILQASKAEGQIKAFTGENLLNCEYVVPQSWFEKKEPMKGDLHHLFAIGLDLFFDADIAEIVSFSLFVTGVSYILGDRFVLPHFGPNAATVFDFLLTYSSVWLFGNIVLNGYLQIAWGSIISAIIVTTAEVFVHRYLLSRASTQESNERNQPAFNRLVYGTEFAEEQGFPKNKNPKK